MQMKSFERNFVFLHMYLYCEKYLKIADFGHFRQLFFGKKIISKNILEQPSKMESIGPLYVGTNRFHFGLTNVFSSRDNFFFSETW